MEPAAPYSFDTPVARWHAKVRRLYDYWLAIHPAPEVFPGRRHLDMAAIADLLPLVWILEVHREPLQFRYSVVGDVHCRAMQRELAGLWMHEAHAEFLKPYFYRNYVNVVNRREPSYRGGRARYGVNPELYEMERVMLPLAENGRDVDAVLALTVYYHRDGTEAFT